MNPTLQEIKYCVVCDNTIITEMKSPGEVVCSEECRVTFSDFEVLYSFKECLYCGQPVMSEGETDFCSEDCSATHEHFEYLRTHCVNCDVKMQEPMVSNVCGELCEKQLALERYLDAQEEYIESKRQEHLDDEDPDF